MPVPLAQQAAAAEQVSTVENLVAVRPAPTGGTTRVIFDDGSFAESYRHAVFVDPGTGQVLGQKTVYGTTGALPLRSWIYELHRSLHLGDAGRSTASSPPPGCGWSPRRAGLVGGPGPCPAFGACRRRPSGGRGARARPDLARRARVSDGDRFLALSATGLTWSQLGGENVTDSAAPAELVHPVGEHQLGRRRGRHGGEHSDHGGGAPAADRRGRRHHHRRGAGRRPRRSRWTPTRSRSACPRARQAPPGRDRGPPRVPTVGGRGAVDPPPCRSPTWCGSPTTRSWPSWPAGAWTCTWAPVRPGQPDRLSPWRWARPDGRARLPHVVAAASHPRAGAPWVGPRPCGRLAATPGWASSSASRIVFAVAWFLPLFGIPLRRSWRWTSPSE